MNFYLRAFLIFFRIGLFTIGVGYSMVPLIEADLVDIRNWVKKEDFLDLMALAQTAVTTAAPKGVQSSASRWI